MKAINNKQHKDLVVAATMSMCKTHGDKKMKKILLDGDIAVIDGKEFTKEEVKNALMDQVRYHKLSDFVQETFNGAGVSNE